MSLIQQPAVPPHAASRGTETRLTAPCGKRQITCMGVRSIAEPDRRPQELGA